MSFEGSLSTALTSIPIQLSTRFWTQEFTGMLKYTQILDLRCMYAPTCKVFILFGYTLFP